MKKQKPKLTHDTVPASVGLVKAVRDELRADIKAVRGELQAEIRTVRDDLRADIRAVEHGLTSKIMGVENGLTSKIEALSTKVDTLVVSVHRSQVLMEEQRGENRIVLDGLKTVLERQDRIETHFDELRGT